jgi:SAM-dependent methyltransferase
MAPGWRRLSFAVLRRIARAGELASRGVMHVGAGLLGPAELRDVAMERWQDFGATDRFVDQGLMPFEAVLYPRFLRKEDAVLLVGCGTGRDLVALLRAGYRVDGLEPAARAAAAARAALLARGLDATVTIGRLEDAPLAGPWDAIVLSWYCYSYVFPREARIAALARLRRHLRPGGRILVSYITADRPPRRAPLAITTAVARLSRSGWRLEPGDVLRSEGGFLHREHHFRPGEFAAEVREAGLAPVFLEDDDEGHAVLAAPAAGVSA